MCTAGGGRKRRAAFFCIKPPVPALDGRGREARRGRGGDPTFDALCLPEEPDRAWRWKPEFKTERSCKRRISVDDS